VRFIRLLVGTQTNEIKDEGDRMAISGETYSTDTSKKAYQSFTYLSSGSTTLGVGAGAGTSIGT
jgi:hypothetical protein